MDYHLFLDYKLEFMFKKEILILRILNKFLKYIFKNGSFDKSVLF